MSLVVGALAVVGFLVTPILVPLALGAMGFGAAGVVAGSTAATIQSGIGNVAAGSLFATAQAIAAGAPLSASLYALLAPIPAITFGAIGWLATALAIL